MEDKNKQEDKETGQNTKRCGEGISGGETQEVQEDKIGVQNKTGSRQTSKADALL